MAAYLVALLSQSVMLMRSKSNTFQRHDAGEGREVEALESEFLESLHETRELEADLSAALRPLLDPQVLVLGWTPQSAVLRHARYLD
jgi:hypothetical protein